MVMKENPFPETRMDYWNKNGLLIKYPNKLKY